MKHTIEVNGIKLYAYHGCLDEEAVVGAHYTVNVKIVTNFSKAIESDKLTDTIDYVSVYNIVKQEMGIRSKLIEHVGQRIINQIKKAEKNIDSIQVKVIKHHPPVGGAIENTAIIIEA